jgi:hypothetical protein
MNVDYIALLVRRADGLFLDGNNGWASQQSAWRYATSVAFDDAELHDAEVIMVLPGGREVPVTRSDFSAPASR